MRRFLTKCVSSFLRPKDIRGLRIYYKHWYSKGVYIVPVYDTTVGPLATKVDLRGCDPSPEVVQEVGAGEPTVNY